ncbi:MAG: hypothetical protein JW959_08025 [Pirellulales bacterium]|nr:hypothetical protein [Pirellulales bacterium]
MNVSAATTGRSPSRLLIEWTAYLVLATLLVETWLLKGLVAPCRVVGGSMAEAALGDHRKVVCADCGFPFNCGADGPPPPPRTVCPNCGHAENDLQRIERVRGDRLLIDRATFSVRAPRRWEVAALRQPTRAEKIVLKRIVGLPGEEIEIRRGDVYIDGRIARKTLEQQRALAVPVHDAAYRSYRWGGSCTATLGFAVNSEWQNNCHPNTHRTSSKTTFLPQWQPENSRSQWMWDNRRFVCRAGNDKEPIDWLVYHHGRRDSSGFVASPVLDLYGYNQRRPRRDEDVHAVADLLLSLRLTCESGRGSFHVRATDGGERFEATLRFDGDRLAYEVRGEEGVVLGGGGRRLIEASLFDRCFLLAIDGKTVFARPIAEENQSPVAAPLAIGAEGMEATVEDLRVYRDVYYTQPIGVASRGATRLGPGEYYVLGDNSPVSEDSRHWPDGGAVGADLLVGKPLCAIPSISVNPFSTWRFSVPNPAGIRYIQ